jgi:hypothetical protein
MLAALLANAPAAIHAAWSLFHAALHTRAAVGKELKEIFAALAQADLSDASTLTNIPAVLERAKELVAEHTAADAAAQQHGATFQAAMADHALTVPPPAVAVAAK